MKTTTAAKLTTAAILPAAMESAPRVGTDGPLLDNRERNGKSTGAKQESEFLRFQHRERACDDAAALADRGVDAGCADHDTVEDDGEKAVDIFSRDVTEPGGTDAIETESYDRAALIETRRGGFETFTADENFCADDIVKPGLLAARHQDGTHRQLPCLGRLGARVLVDEMKCQFRRLSQA